MIRYNTILTILGMWLVLLGIIIRGIGIRTLGEYFSRDVETWENQKVVKTGIYKHIRHPAYAGNILQVIGFPLILNSYFSLVLSAITIFGFIWRIRVEEEFLKREVPEYRKYIEETKGIIPKIW
ncbi:MAG: methyltransferase family protein [Tepidanaerobacteraceae bacterium]